MPKNQGWTNWHIGRTRHVAGPTSSWWMGADREQFRERQAARRHAMQHNACSDVNLSFSEGAEHSTPRPKLTDYLPSN